MRALFSTSRSIAAALMLVGCVAAPAAGQEEGGDAGTLSGEVSFDVGSRYVWRGLRISRGLVSQVEIDAEFKGVGVGIWSNYDPHEYPFESGGRRQVTETDVTLWYGRPWGPGVATGGLVYYGLRGGPDTTELFVAYELGLPLAPSATLFVDVDEGDGAFLLLAATQPLSITDSIAIDVGVEAGVNLDNRVMGTGADDHPFAGPYHAEIWTGSSIPLGRGLSISPRVAVSFPLGRRAGDAIAWSSYDGETRTCVYGSVGVTAGF
jgi:hypothetical protein